MVRLALVVLWPSFMVAIMAEGFFFSLFDPADLLLVGGHVDLNPMAAYTLGFLFFSLQYMHRMSHIHQKSHLRNRPLAIL